MAPPDEPAVMLFPFLTPNPTLRGTHAGGFLR